MTSYLATIRIEAFGLAEAKEEAAWIADHSRSEQPAEVVSVRQEIPLEGRVCLPSVAEAIEAAKSELRAEADITYRCIKDDIESTKRQCLDAIGSLRAEVAEALDVPSDLLVERVAKRLAERRLLG